MRAPVSLEGKILRNYLFQRFGVKPTGNIPAQPKSHNHPCVETGSKCKRTVASYEYMSFYHMGWKKQALRIADANERAPKLLKIAEYVHQDPEKRKTCIILHRESGYELLLDLLTQYGVSAVALKQVPTTGAGQKTGRVANETTLRAFNGADNVNGEKCRSSS